MLVAGVDGCRGGWLVAVAQADPFEVVSLAVVESLADLVDDEGVALIAVDMPIGLSSHGRRACDVAARRLSGPRRSSVFPAPVRAVLDAVDYPDALARSRAASGIGLSIQTWNLVPRIAELDSLMSPGSQPRVRETFPELCFARLAGEPLAHPKRTAAGRAQRVALIGPPPPTPRGAAADDVLDAIVLARAGCDFARGDGRSVGDEVDDRGLRMQIWW